MKPDHQALFASVLRLSPQDSKALKISDAYSIHRVVYDLFPDVRDADQKQASIPSGILYADKGNALNERIVVLLSDRSPNPSPAYGELNCQTVNEQFLNHQHYRFQVTLNPAKRDRDTGKIIGLSDAPAISEWFLERCEKSWGFTVKPSQLHIDQIGNQRFKKNTRTVITHSSAHLSGQLQVCDRELFIHSIRQGIGRGRAFGFGLLQVAPLDG